MSPSIHVARAVLARNLRVLSRNPAIFLPPVLAPLVFYASFAGGLSGVANTPGFNYPLGYTGFQFMFVLCQSAIFNGVINSLGLARDFESGFARRLMLGARSRGGIIAGYLATGFLRGLLAATIITALGLVLGVRFRGGFIGALAILGIVSAIMVAGGLFGAGVALRIQAVSSAPVMQVPVILILFLSPAFVPYELLSGWVRNAATGNPLTPFLSTGRAFLADLPRVPNSPTDPLIVVGVALGLVALTIVWAITGMRRAELKV